MINVKKWLAALMTAAMVFTSAGIAPISSVAVFAAADAAVVTTDDGTASYSSFMDALTATLNDTENATKHATITLNEDAVVSGQVNITMPLTIELNGNKLTETDTDKLVVSADPAKGDICRGEIVENNIITKLIFAEHDYEVVYNWKYDETAKTWSVVSVSQICDNCGVKTIKPAPGVTTDNTSLNRFEYTEGGKVVSYKEYEVQAPDAYSISSIRIASVNGVLQHANGLPVVKVIMTKIDSGALVDVQPEVTAATDKEIKDNTGKIYCADGTSVAATTNLGAEYAVGEKNAAATCSKFGATVYKVVVTDPDGKETTKFLRDHQAAEKVDHVAGAFKGYQIQVKSSTGYASEAAALNDGGASVLRVTTEKDASGVNKYYYWTWAAVVPVNATRDAAVAAPSAVGTLTIDQSNVDLNDGSFIYRPVYYCDTDDSSNTEVFGDDVTVAPYADATTAQQAAGNYSSCTAWKYPAVTVTYEYTKAPSDAVKTKFTCKGTVSTVNKAEPNHVSDGTKYVPNDNKQPTCTTPGEATVHCAICDSDVTVDIPVRGHTFAAFTGTSVTSQVVDPTLTETHTATLSADKTEATIAATCMEDGGVYKYCSGTNNANVGHWEKQSTIAAKGHDLSTIVMDGNWKVLESGATALRDFNTNEVYNKNNDYIFIVDQKCKNDGDNAIYTVRYHSIAGVDTGSDIYSAITIVDQDKGADCQTQAKTVYTVNGLTNTIGNAFTKEVNKGAATVGAHVYEVTAWNWSNDFETATVTAKCTVKGDTATTADALPAKVTKETAENGITTYTATYGEATDTKKVYTLKDAIVTYDTSAITDANLVTGIDDYVAPQVPDVTVSVNGTVIDSSLYTTAWSVDSVAGSTTAKKVYATVDWTTEVKNSKDAEHVTLSQNPSSDPLNVAKMNEITGIDTTVYEDGEDYNSVSVYEDYDPERSYSVETVAKGVKDATVKYAVVDKQVTVKSSVSAADKWALQRKIEELDFNLDSVEDIQDAGTYWVYVQIKADGYTTYTSGPVALIDIDEKDIIAYVDNATVVEGDKPNLHIRAVDFNTGRDVEIDQDDFTITTVGGESLENLKAGTYSLHITAKNYIVRTTYQSYTATLTVLPKDSSTAEDQAKAESVTGQINALNENSSAADVAAARAAYDALTDTQKKRVDADVVKKLEAAEAAVTAKVVDALKAVTDDTPADVAAKAVNDYNALSPAQKAVVQKDAAAVSGLTKASAISGVEIAGKEASKVTIKSKAKVKVKRGKAFTVKYTKVGDGKVTMKISGNKKVKKFFKVSGKKIKVSKKAKKGKYKVKVTISIAATAAYKAAKANKTIKVTVK